MSNILTTKQGVEFMKKVKELIKEDFEKCANIIDLLVHSVYMNRPVDYSMCAKKTDTKNSSTKNT